MVLRPYRCVQGAYGRGLRGSEGNKKSSNRIVRCSCIQGNESFKSFSKLKVSNISSAFSLFDSRLFPSSEDCLQEYGKDNPSSLDQLLWQWATSGVWGQDMGFHNWYWQTRHRTIVQSILKHVVVTVRVVLYSTSLRQHHQSSARSY